MQSLPPLLSLLHVQSQAEEVNDAGICTHMRCIHTSSTHTKHTLLPISNHQHIVCNTAVSTPTMTPCSTHTQSFALSPPFNFPTPTILKKAMEEKVTRHIGHINKCQENGMAILFLWSVVSISMHNLKQPNSTACPNDMFKITAKTCYLVDVVCASSLNCYKRTIQLMCTSKTDQAESALKKDVKY